MSIELWDWIGMFHCVQYEQLLEEGTKGLLQLLEETSGHRAQCEPIAPAPNRLKNYKRRKPFLESMNEMVDWKAEALIGYQLTMEE